MSVCAGPDAHTNSLERDKWNPADFWTYSAITTRSSLKVDSLSLGENYYSLTLINKHTKSSLRS